MGMTMTQKILAAHAGLPEVKAGQLIRAKLDMVLGNDITSPVAIREFDKEGFTGVFDKSKISMVMDHFTPNKDIKAAEQCLQCRTFAHRFDIDNFYDVGQMGVEHALLPRVLRIEHGDGAEVAQRDRKLRVLAVRAEGIVLPAPEQEPIAKAVVRLFCRDEGRGLDLHGLALPNPFPAQHLPPVKLPVV